MRRFSTTQRSTLQLGLLAFALASLGSSLAIGQTVWDPERFEALVVESNFFYDTALDLPQSDQEERRQLLIESAESKREAIEMLRSALVAGELEQYAEQARQELLYLEQNMVVLLAQLGFCGAANTRLDAAMADPSLLPEAGVGELEQTRTRIEECVAVATAEPVAEESTDEVDETNSEVSTERSEEEAASDSESDVLVQQETTDDADGPSPIPFVVMGTGAALVIAGIAFDLTLSDELDEFEQIQSDCQSGACDAERGLALQGELTDARPITGLLLGTGAATIIVGAVLWLTSDRETDQPVAINPSLFSFEF